MAGFAHSECRASARRKVLAVDGWKAGFQWFLFTVEQEIQAPMWHGNYPLCHFIGRRLGHAATLEAGAGGLSDEIAKNGTAEVFADGFESGTTAAWSDTVPPSSPDQIANLWGWWDAAVGVTVTDGLVSIVADQSANNRHWTQTSAPDPPAVRSCGAR